MLRRLGGFDGAAFWVFGSSVTRAPFLEHLRCVKGLPAASCSRVSENSAVYMYATEAERYLPNVYKFYM